MKAQGFKEGDPNVIANLTDRELADFQSKYSQGTRSFILAEYEWQRRLTAQQIRATSKSAWLGLIGVILGGLIGIVASNSAAILSYILASHRP